MEGISHATPASAVGVRRPIWKRLVLSRLRGLTKGQLTVADAEGEVTIGAPAADGLRVRVTIHRPRLWRRVAFGGLLAAIEAHAEGDWDADDLTRLARLFSRHVDEVARLDGGLGRVLRPVSWLHERLSRNSRRGARRNIAAHYDLGNDFFALMLDRTMTYSCGLFADDTTTLEDASVAKIDQLCRKLALGPDDHLLEIGTGWGAFAIRAATRFGCRVTTVTISREQFDLARRRVSDAGLTDRVDVRLTDYRDLDGQYSKIVSVEMIEAVGAEYYDAFFRTCAARLAPDGLMALQAITVADQRFEAARRAPDFIKRHIFPGSCIPSIGALTGAAARASDLRLIDLEDFTPHYARTLSAWRANLERHEAAVARLTTEPFRRMWHFYLAYCEGGFAERHTGLVQMVLARPAWRGRGTLHGEMAGWTAAS